MHNYTPSQNESLVLVVDDDPSVRKALGRLLRSAGFGVETFASAAELLAFERPPGRSCLVLDLHLPDMDGLELLQRIVAEAPDLPVVVFTGESRPETRARALRGGAAAFVVKPGDQERLLDEVERLLKG